ncbi:MAG: hypothetical protein K2Y39_24125 [Candidatus Obscuribacterales bacterium]|nr:hypothetical protein [Candidatus Obscuribacterales bacterium]
MIVDKKLPLSNDQIAEKLSSIGALLEERSENLFRVRAYRKAAAVLKKNARQVSEILATEGLDGLMNLEGVGVSLAHVIEKIASDGHVLILDRLLSETKPEQNLGSVPGIGKKLAEELHSKLGIENLHDLEVAAYDGRLAAMPGIGKKRLCAIRDCLSGRFHRLPVIEPSKPREGLLALPTIGVAEILDIDEEYSLRVKKHTLPLIAPKKFNPTKSPWLPILHTVHNGRHYTAMYSNTARANELGTQKDWVVIFLDGSSQQWTVVTAHYGQLAGKRVVRGHERECADYYSSYAENR